MGKQLRINVRSKFLKRLILLSFTLRGNQLNSCVSKRFYIIFSGLDIRFEFDFDYIISLFTPRSVSIENIDKTLETVFDHIFQQLELRQKYFVYSFA